jgi:hypothetical protein
MEAVLLWIAARRGSRVTPTAKGFCGSWRAAESFLKKPLDNAAKEVILSACLTRASADFYGSLTTK